MQITRRFTNAGQDVFSTVEWTTRTSRITNADGSVVFEMKDAEVPKSWSQLATDIMVSKYFRKAGIPQSDANGEPVLDDNGKPVTGPERSVRQVVQRLAGCWRHWGEEHDYFDSVQDAQAFQDEMSHMLLNQMAAPNSPQWFNTGLNWAYGISGPAQGHWVVDGRTGEAGLAPDAYTHPQPHACFIQAVDDDLVNPGGIMDLWTREARLFKYGSGTGTNFSAVRGEGECLSGGGKSSGLMSFLKIGDRAAGAIKSGGTTRRAAKMVCLNADHPDIEQFVSWKVREELKVAALVEGLRHLSKEQRELATELGLILDYDFNGEAYFTVSGQNANNSVRLTDDFLKALETDGDWDLIRRIDGDVHKTIKARDLWDKICGAAWHCADPGLQFDTTINAWHTCPDGGRINASNPCSEYMFLDNTACNLASINLLKFYDAQQRTFDIESFEHAVRLWTVVLEISVLMAAFPSREIAEQSYRYRTLGLGYANLGAMLMQASVPYDSDEARALCGALTAIMTGRSYSTSAELASEMGAFPGFTDNRDSMLRVIRNHRRAAYGVARDADSYEALPVRPVPIDHAFFDRDSTAVANAGELLERALATWDEALEQGQRHGFRNAQVSVIAPTGTIGLLMDCDTTGVEPDFALTKFKKLAGGGYFKIANQSLRPALHSLGYAKEEIVDILTYVMGSMSLDTPLPQERAPRNSTAGALNASSRTSTTLRDLLRTQGYRPNDLETVQDLLPSVFEVTFAFSAWSIPDHVLEQMDGVDSIEAARKDPAFNGLRHMGLSASVIQKLNLAICGTQTVEGAPHLRDKDLAVFDCANRCGDLGTRFIKSGGHIRMMAAAQPFISGAISKTINLPNEAEIDDIADAYRTSWDLGLKATALYRDGSKLAQVLTTSSTTAEDLDEPEDELDTNAGLEEVGNDVISTAAAVSTSSNGVHNNDAADTPDANPVPCVERIVERIIERPMRQRLPDTRRSLTHRFNVAGHEGYLTAGLYDDGSPGELFITMSKEGSTIGGLMDSLGTAISVALQYGVPLESLVKKFEHQRFEPMGMSTNRDIPFAKSLVDYIFRWLGMEFISGYREANAPRRTPTAGGTSESGAVRAGNTRVNTKVKEDDVWQRAQQGGGTSATRQPPDSNGAPGAPRTSASASDAQNPTIGDPISATAAGSATTLAESSIESKIFSGLDHSNAAMQTDAPACDVCGLITVRNGTCYRCLNCGNSMGCS